AAALAAARRATRACLLLHRRTPSATPAARRWRGRVEPGASSLRTVRTGRRADNGRKFPGLDTLQAMPAPASESAAVARGANPFADTEDQAALRQLARDVAERSLAPMARQGDETEEFPQASWDAMRQAELFGITIGEQW